MNIVNIVIVTSENKTNETQIGRGLRARPICVQFIRIPGIFCGLQQEEANTILSSSKLIIG